MRLIYIYKFVLKKFFIFLQRPFLIFPLFLLISLICTPIFFISGKVKKAPVREDGVGYYAYLPAVFIYKDLNFSFLIDENAKYSEGINSFERKFNPIEAKILGFNKLKNGKFIDKYPIGVSVLLSPFFILGHLMSEIFNQPKTGWSFFYQYSCFFGSLNYFFIGILYLLKSLKQISSIRGTVFAILITVFGTSLLNYAVYENFFSHVFSFCFASMLIWLVISKAEKKLFKIGIVLGILCLIRLTNFYMLLFWVVYSFWRSEINKKNIKIFIFNTIKIVFVAFVILLPQFFYMKFASGKFFFNSYEGEYFAFFSPKLFNVLFSVRKGLFFWSPLLFLSFFAFVNFQHKFLLKIASILVIICQVFIVASWWNWEYGFSFGHRAFVDVYPFFALLLSLFFDQIQKKWLKISILIFSVLLLLLNLFQMIQYWLKILPPAWTTFDEYKMIFLKLDPKLRLFYREKFKKIYEENKNDKKI